MRHSLLLFLLSIFYSCQPTETTLTEEYFQSHRQYTETLAKGRDHYLKLVGLHPLVKGVNFFGAATDNNIQLASQNIPPTIGAIEYDSAGLEFTASDSLEIRTLEEDSLVNRWNYEFVTTINSPMLKYKHLEWQVIKRGDEYFLRVKDQKSNLAKQFKGFQSYPLQAKYLLEAEFTPFEESQSQDVNTQLGTAQQMNFAGVLSFELNEKNYSVLVGEGGFLILGDLTNDKTTYGGGRYVYVDLPEEAGQLTLDLNRLYNPPCVYSEYTTCPLPPSQNVLPIAIEAGEKYARL